MKLQALRFIGLSLLLLAVPAAAGAQEYEGDASLEGKVVNAEGQGLTDAMVTAELIESASGPEAVTANDSGEFEVEDIRPGRWRLTAAAPALGYGAARVEVDVLADDTPAVEIVLQPLQAMVDEANARLQAREYAAAREIYENVAIALPDNVNLHQPIALTYQAEGNHEQALEHIDLLLAGWEAQGAAAQQDPAVATEVKLQAVQSSANLKDYPRMRGYLDAIGEENLGPGNVNALLQISANTLMAENQAFDEAKSMLDIVLRHAPNSPLPYYYRGMANVRLEQDEEARADLTKFIELSPTETTQVTQAKEILTKLEEMNEPSAPGSE